ncbi:hypothetical protein GGR57DRAFT_453637 [Xylariaceae sp. FL1272]|nr:hypothetical protein GGR57DRAFT_453637 [Xylariaceae sp. FL1272]
MKFALPSKLYALAHHTHGGPRRSKSGHDSIASSRSSKSWPYDYSHVKPQIIRGSWVDGDRLKELLNRKFGSNYRLQLRSDDYRLFASERLTEEEIMWCAISVC